MINDKLSQTWHQFYAYMSVYDHLSVVWGIKQLQNMYIQSEQKGEENIVLCNVPIMKVLDQTCKYLKIFSVTIMYDIWLVIFGKWILFQFELF